MRRRQLTPRLVAEVTRCQQLRLLLVLVLLDGAAPCWSMCDGGALLAGGEEESRVRFSLGGGAGWGREKRQRTCSGRA